MNRYAIASWAGTPDETRAGNHAAELSVQLYADCDPATNETGGLLIVQLAPATDVQQYELLRFVRDEISPQIEAFLKEGFGLLLQLRPGGQAAEVNREQRS